MANESYRAKTRLYTDASREKVLPHGHPDAAYLLVGAGGELPFSIAEKYNLFDKTRKGKSEMDNEKIETKAEEKPEKVKAVLEPPKNKSISGPEKSK